METLSNATEICTCAKEKATCLFSGETTIKVSTIVKIALACVAIGALIGFILSPIKNGFYFNISNNGNTVDDFYDDYEEEEKSCLLCKIFKVIKFFNIFKIIRFIKQIKNR